MVLASVGNRPPKREPREASDDGSVRRVGPEAPEEIRKTRRFLVLSHENRRVFRKAGAGVRFSFFFRSEAMSLSPVRTDRLRCEGTRPRWKAIPFRRRFIRFSMQTRERIVINLVFVSFLLNEKSECFRIAGESGRPPPVQGSNFSSF